MRHLKGVEAVILAVFFLSGCARVHTQVVEKPRVDQEVAGNRGYLTGSGGASAARKATRQMIETNVELPTLEELNPWRARKAPEPQPVARGPAAPGWEAPVEELPEEEFEPVPSPRPETSMKEAVHYTVEKGDTLQKISQKFYGTTRKWNRIYEANRTVLRGPNRVYPGQKLVIPPLEDTPGQRARGGEEFK